MSAIDKCFMMFISQILLIILPLHWLSLSHGPLHIFSCGWWVSQERPRDCVELGFMSSEKAYRIVLAGDAAVGKSSFLLRLCKNEFKLNGSATLGRLVEMVDEIIFIRNTGQHSLNSLAISAVISALARQIHWLLQLDFTSIMFLHRTSCYSPNAFLNLVYTRCCNWWNLDEKLNQHDWLIGGLSLSDYWLRCHCV